MRTACALAACFLLTGPAAQADDYFLTIGGGYSPGANQVSLEKNVLFFQRVLQENHSGQPRSDIYFADGDAPGRDLEVMDRASVPKPNRLMAEFFGSRSNLGLSYRNHQIPGMAPIGPNSEKRSNDLSAIRFPFLLALYLSIALSQRIGF